MAQAELTEDLVNDLVGFLTESVTRDDMVRRQAQRVHERPGLIRTKYAVVNIHGTPAGVAAQSAYFERWGPLRVEVEIAAKRAILDEFARAEPGSPCYDGLLYAMRAFAGPLCGEPGYDERFSL